MSFILGKVSLGPHPLPPSARQQIDRLLADAPGRTFRFDSPHAAVRKVDLGVFEDDGFAADGSNATVIAGHPLMPSPQGIQGASAGRGATTLNRSSPAELQELATSARGTWAACRFAESPRELTLISDRIGARPLYWWTDGHTALFASTIRAASGMFDMDLKVDVRAVVEELILGYPLSDRTHFYGIKRVGPGEIVRISARGAVVCPYAQWPLDGDASEDVGARARRTLAALRTAVEIRAQGRSEAITFLSGGMDSRAINALLHEQGLRIHAFTFSPEDRLDNVLARAYAEVIDCHHVVRSDLGWVNLNFADTLKRAWADEGTPPTQARFESLLPAWSGDGGSVCGGWVYLTDTMVRGLREGRPRDAVGEYLRRYASSISPQDIVAEGRTWLRTAVTDSILAELARTPAPDPVTAFFHFLVRNDQRRHLDRHHENILEHGVEFWLPFFDTEFLLHSFAALPDENIGHGFYSRWFELLPDHSRSVAWQTYPGHRPCPIPLPDNLTDQWAGLSASDRQARARHSRKMSLRVFRPRFPVEVFSRKRFLLRFVAHHLRLRDSGTAFDQLDMVSRYLRDASGSVLPWVTPARQLEGED